jgi:hypothetical protein
MRKHFLLVFLLALLPLVGWAQTVSWKSGKTTEEFPYGTTPAFEDLITVVSGYGGHACEFNIVSNTTPTGNVNQYNYCVVQTNSESATQYTGPLVVDYTYYLKVRVRHQNSGYGYGDNTRLIPFKIVKADAEVLLYSFNIPYGSAEPTVATMPSGSYSVSGATWDEVKGSLTWSRTEPGTDCGVNYAYTLTAGNNTNYNITVIPNGAQLSFTKIDATLTAATDGANITYDGDAHKLAPTAIPTFEDTYSNPAGTFMYTLEPSDDSSWSTEYPEGTNAATYTVSYKVVADGNHNENTAVYTYDVTIDPADPTIAVTSVGGAATAPEFTYPAADFDVANFVYDQDTDGTPSAYAYTKNGASVSSFDGSAGAWTVAVTFTAGTNWNAGTTAPFAFTVGKAPITSADYTLPSAVGGLVWDGSNMDLHTELVWTAGAKGTVRYWRNDTGDWNTNVRWRNVAGDWQIRTAIMPGANYEFASTDEYITTVNVGGDTYYIVQDAFDVSIAQAEVTIANTGSVFTREYDSSAQVLVNSAPTFTGVGGANVAGTVTYAWNDGENDLTATAIGDVKATNVGEYPITFTFEPTSNNYKPITEPQELANGVAAEITKAKLHLGTMTVDNKVITDVYDFATDTYYLTAADFLNADDSEFKSAADLAKKDEILNALVQTDLDIAKLKVGGNTILLSSITGSTENYEAVLLSDPVDATLNIKAIPVVLTAPVGKASPNPVYNGENQSLVATAATIAPEKGKIVYSLTGEDGSWVEDATTAETTIVGKNADTYTVYYNVELSDAADSEERFYEYTDGVQDIDVTIDPKDIADAVFTIEPASLPYNGTNQNETAITIVPDEAEKLVPEDDIKSIALPAEVIAKGEYDVTIEGQGNYTGTTTKKFNITQADDNEITDPTIAGWTYGEDPNAPSATATYAAAGEPTYTYYEDNDGVPSTTALTGVPTEAGNYWVVASVAETEDYNGIASDPVAFTIAKAEAAIDAPVANKLTYNGKDQDLVEAAVSADGEFEYSIDGGETWTNTVSVGKDAGTYTVQTKFIPDGNHKDATVGDVTVTIKQAALGYMLGGTTKPWNGESLTEDELATVFTLYSGELFENDAYDVPFTLSLLEDYKDANETGYNFTQAKYEFKEGYPVNYTINFSGTGTVIIKKADITKDDFEAPEALTLPFTGKDQELLKAGKVTTKYEEKEIGSFVYSNEEEGEYGEAIPTGKIVSGYTVWYKVVGDKNHNDTEPVALTSTITAKELKDEFFKLSATTAQYNKTNLMPEVTTVEGEPITTEDYIITVTNGEGKEVKQDKEVVNVDTYTLTFTPNPEKPGNYSGAAKAEFEITKRPAQAVAWNATKVYDGLTGLQTADPEDEDGIVDVKFTFTNLVPGDDDAISMGDAVYFDKEAKNVGVYTMKFNLDAFASQNYEVIGVEDNGAQFEITKAPLTITWNEKAEGFTKVYDGKSDKDVVYAASSENIVLEGAISDEESTIIANVVIKRVDDAQDVNEDPGYDLALSAKQIYETPNWVDAHVFDNYDYEFGNDGIAEGAFTITPASIIVSLAPQKVTYTGVAIKELVGGTDFTADDLVVTHLKGGNVKDAVFTTLPKVTVTAKDGAVNAGEYELTLSGAVATNYEIDEESGYMTSTLTIEPAPLTFEFTPQQIAKGENVEDVIDPTLFTVTGIVDADAEKEIFAVDVNEDLMDKNADITADPASYDDGLIIIALDEEAAANYSGWEEAAGVLVVIAPETVVLDDSNPVYKAQKGVTVTFESRDINYGTWNVLALPFETSPAQISNAFGFAAVDVLNEDDGSSDVHFKVITSGKIPAYTPMIVKTTEDEGLVKKNFNQIIFNGVNIEERNEQNSEVLDAYGNKFIGTFEKETTFTGEQYWYMSKGDWYDASQRSITLKPFRAYVEFKTAGARIFVEEPDGTVTAIDAATFNKTINEGMYNLNGMKVNNANRKGVFIQNGKKVVK